MAISTRPRVVLEPASRAFVEATSTPPFIYELAPAEARKVLDDVQADPIEKPRVDERWITVSADVGRCASESCARPMSRGRSRRSSTCMAAGGSSATPTHTIDSSGSLLSVPKPPSCSSSTTARRRRTTPSLSSRATRRHSGSFATGPRTVSTQTTWPSVGGCMTAALALMAKERGDVRFVQQSMWYPAAMDTESYEEFAEGYFLTPKGMAWFWDAYLPDLERRSEPFASPLRASDEQLHGLPPAFVIVDEADVLRDEGEVYAARLRAAGVAVTTVRYDGITHDFMMLNPLSDTHATRAAVAQASSVLRDALWRIRP